MRTSVKISITILLEFLHR